MLKLWPPNIASISSSNATKLAGTEIISECLANIFPVFFSTCLCALSITKIRKQQD